jgi:hypothetical protein
MLEIISRITDWAGGKEQAMAWYRAQPISAMGGRTAESMVKAGEADSGRRVIGHTIHAGLLHPYPGTARQSTEAATILLAPRLCICRLRSQPLYEKFLRDLHTNWIPVCCAHMQSIARRSQTCGPNPAEGVTVQN